MLKTKFALLFWILSLLLQSIAQDYSKTGFYLNDESPRKVYNFNGGWWFYKGDIEGAFQSNFDDKGWDLVNLPHGLELLAHVESARNCGSGNRIW